MNIPPEGAINNIGSVRRDEPGAAQTTAILRDVVPFGEAARSRHPALPTVA